MSASEWVALAIGIMSFIGTIYGHISVAKTSREKTVQAVKDEMTSIREESQTKDREMHAEIVLFKQETASGLELIRKDIGTLSGRVEKHNSVIERVFKLEQDAAVQTEQIKVANHRIEDLERVTAK